jgi:hypothetical protein
VNPHFGQPVSAGSDGVIQQAQLGQRRHPTRIDVLGTGFVPGKAGFVEQQDRMTRPGQQERGDTAGWTATDDNDFCVARPTSR